MNQQLISHEEKRKIAVKFIVHHNGQFMCVTNWSNSYSAGVCEFNSDQEAKEAGNARINSGSVQIYGFNEFGERIQ